MGLLVPRNSNLGAGSVHSNHARSVMPHLGRQVVPRTASLPEVRLTRKPTPGASFVPAGKAEHAGPLVERGVSEGCGDELPQATREEGLAHSSSSTAWHRRTRLADA